VISFRCLAMILSRSSLTIDMNGITPSITVPLQCRETTCSLHCARSKPEAYFCATKSSGQASMRDDQHRLKQIGPHHDRTDQSDVCHRIDADIHLYCINNSKRSTSCGQKSTSARVSIERAAQKIKVSWRKSRTSYLGKTIRTIAPAPVHVWYDTLSLLRPNG